jgi:hypothetical protein
MNQRIQELVKQSGGEFWQRLENDAVNPEAYITFDPLESLDKFVELIVQECIDQCADNGSNDEWDKGVRWAANQIKQHFGVEE